MSRPGAITGARNSRRVASDASIVQSFLAIVGSFMNSYTADKYDRLMQARFVRGKGIRIGRDVRVLKISLGSFLNQPFLTLSRKSVGSTRFWMRQARR